MLRIRVYWGAQLEPVDPDMTSTCQVLRLNREIPPECKLAKESELRESPYISSTLGSFENKYRIVSLGSFENKYRIVSLFNKFRQWLLNRFTLPRLGLAAIQFTCNCTVELATWHRSSDS